ncbi:MAG TPA: MEDS domain-containing protein [Acidobacteriaceae bacterium]|nr:MEDS domain-containing protein [Acidobacteriaceae bacterium]
MTTFIMGAPMEQVSRHQCLIYAGPPSRHLAALAVTLRAKLWRNYRCLYLNSPSMVAGIRSFLAAADVDVEEEIARGSLVLSAEQGHLVDGQFDVRRMLETLDGALAQALHDGYAGLWATGDMTWEMGPQRDSSKLLDYEWHLEEFMRKHPEMSGICQYHADTLPREMLRHGLLAHRSIFVNETLSLVNPQYLRPESVTDVAANTIEINAALDQLCELNGAAD